MRKNNRTAWPLQTDVAKALNLSPTTVSKYCRKQGWSKRGSGHRPPLTPEQVKEMLNHFAPRVPKTTLDRATYMFYNYMCGVNMSELVLSHTHNENTHTIEKPD